MSGRRAAESPRTAEGSVRERLIAAMVAVAGERGYGQASVERVCGQAGVGRDQFAAEFSSREDCFLEAWDEIYGRFVARCMAAYERPGSWRERLRAAAEQFRAFVSEEPAASRVLLVELLEAGQRGLARRDLAVRSFASLFDAGRDEHAAPDDVPYEVALAVSGAIFVTLRKQLAERSGSPEKLMRELMCMAVMPYLGVEAAMRELGDGPGTRAA